MEEAKSAAPKFGDPWGDHAKVASFHHHASQADQHAEAAQYHNHAKNALDDYLHNPYKAARGPLNDSIKELQKSHRASAAFHQGMLTKHSRMVEKLDGQEAARASARAWPGVGALPKRNQSKK